MQFAREVKKKILSAMPRVMQDQWLTTHPNWRKAAPPRAPFVFDQYLGGLSVNIDTRYKVERIMWTGAYESAFQNWMQRNVKAGWCCVDVGANVGAITLGMALRAAPNGRVIAIEPGKTNTQRLHANLRLNPALEQNVTVIEAGVGDTAGTLNWIEETENPGNAMLELSPLYAKQTGAHQHPVQVLTLDTHLAQVKAGAVNFIKIDVEGMEINVLRGGLETLRRDKPLLFFETLDRYSKTDQGGSLGEIEALLTPLGYQYYRLNADGGYTAFSPPQWPDYTLAIPSEKR